jgi:hypothetical protein
MTLFVKIPLTLPSPARGEGFQNPPPSTRGGRGRVIFLEIASPFYVDFTLRESLGEY